MEKQNKKNSAENLSAENEGNITPLQLLQEIQPLLKEYFIGDFEIQNNALKMTFLNGQIFELSVEEANAKN